VRGAAGGCAGQRPSPRSFGPYLRVSFTYLFDNGLRKCLAHGERMSKSNLVRVRLLVGGGAQFVRLGKVKRDGKAQGDFFRRGNFGDDFLKDQTKEQALVEKKTRRASGLQGQSFSPVSSRGAGKSKSLAGCTE